MTAFLLSRRAQTPKHQFPNIKQGSPSSHHTPSFTFWATGKAGGEQKGSLTRQLQASVFPVLCSDLKRRKRIG